jgi:hypothetical protein
MPDQQGGSVWILIMINLKHICLGIDKTGDHDLGGPGIGVVSPIIEWIGAIGDIVVGFRFFRLNDLHDLPQRL